MLKDASATALCGAKAGNGVIVITTKKEAGPPSVTYSGQLPTREGLVTAIEPFT
ncbi:MAG: hypothetical protein ACLU4J_22135 [Butyricimonas paravirosa]